MPAPGAVFGIGIVPTIGVGFGIGSAPAPVVGFGIGIVPTVGGFGIGSALTIAVGLGSGSATASGVVCGIGCAPVPGSAISRGARRGHKSCGAVPGASGALFRRPGGSATGCRGSGRTAVIAPACLGNSGGSGRSITGIGTTGVAGSTDRTDEAGSAASGEEYAFSIKATNAWYNSISVCLVICWCSGKSHRTPHLACPSNLSRGGK
jgi:hypothetical protein